MPAPRVSVDAFFAFISASLDALEFVTTSDILPQFHAWMLGKDGVEASMPVDELEENLSIILAYGRGEDHPYLERTAEVKPV